MVDLTWDRTGPDIWDGMVRATGKLMVCSWVLFSGLPIIRAFRSACVVQVVLSFVLGDAKAHIKRSSMGFDIVLQTLHVGCDS